MGHSKISLITGSAQGIGKAIALELLEQGHTLALVDKDQAALDVFISELPKEKQKRVNCWTLDVTSKPLINEVIAEIEQRLGPIHYLAHAAGILKLSPLLQMQEGDFDSLMDVHVRSSFYLLKTVGQYMVQRKKGAIVVIGSNGASTPRINMGGYCSSKAALHMLTKCFALELSQYGIRCNLVSPGSTRTNMQSQMWNENYQESHTISGNPDQFRLGIPLNKIADPKDIAQGVSFLLSDKSAHITMHDLRIDGGATLDQR